MFFNSQTSQREQAARMTQIAVGILSEEPEYSPDDTQPDPLRNWAVSVLQQPGETIPLDDEAAEALRRQGLPRAFSAIKSGLAMKSLSDKLCEINKIAEGLSAGDAIRACEAAREEVLELFQKFESMGSKDTP